MEILTKLQELEGKLSTVVPSKKHDLYAIASIQEAINSAKSGTYGVGAILVHNETGEIKYKGQNKVFSESRSDLHAEMDVLNTFETEFKDKSRTRIKDYTMYTSLESCPMCLCRLITSGLMEVYHVADDFGGGMVHLYDKLPPVWKDISKERVFAKAECSEELSKIAEQVFLLTVDLDKDLADGDFEDSTERKKNL